MQEETKSNWKVNFLNLPCDEQLYFAQKVAIDDALHKEYLQWLKENEDKLN
jgi:hypothetical protein